MADAAYHRFLASRTWFWLRKRALHRAGGACERCDATDPLDVHHRTYVRFGGQERPEDLQVLCHSCHAVMHDQTPNPARARGGPQRLQVAVSDYLGRLWDRTTTPPTPGATP